MPSLSLRGPVLRHLRSLGLPLTHVARGCANDKTPCPHQLPPKEHPPAGQVTHRLAWPGPGADEALLAGGDDAVLQEQQHRQPLLGNLLTHEGLQQWHLVDTWAQCGAQHFGRVQATYCLGTPIIV